MKKLLIHALVGTATAVGLYAQVPANNPVTNGNLALLAGWDFNAASASNSLNARYSDVFYSTGSNLNGNAAVGRLFFDGTNGSDNWASLVRSTGSNIDGNQPIASRNIGSSVTFTGDFGSQSGTGAAFEFDVNGEIDSIAFGFNSASTANLFTNINLQFRASILNWVNTSDNVTINWSYAIGSGAPVSTGIFTTINATPFTTYNVNFSSVTAMNGQDDVFLLATFVEGDGNAPVRLDNFGIYGTAAAIPEPSTFGAFAGLAVLGMAALRRRRRAA